MFKLYKIALSINDAINKFHLLGKDGKIIDPQLLFFISRFSNIKIPWNQMKKREDVNNYIKNVLLIDLKEQIESSYGDKNSNVDITPGQKEKLNNKKESLEEWWNVLTEESPFAENPSFAYSMLKPIIENTGRGTAAPIDLNALNSIFKKIEDTEGKESFKIDKEYLKEASKNLAEENSEVDEINPDGRWKKLPGPNTSKEEFEKSVEALSVYGAMNNWCVKDPKGFGIGYLRQGNFWVYLENGNPKATIRFIGDSIQEIRGYNNSYPGEYFENIINFFKKKQWTNKIGSSSQAYSAYNFLKQGETVNKHFEEDPQYRQEILEQANDGDYIVDRANLSVMKDIQLLNQKNRNLPEVQEAIKNGFLKQLKRGGEASIRALDQVTKDQLKSPEILEAATNLWLSNLKNDFGNTIKKNVPKEIKKDPRYQEVVIEGVLRNLDRQDEIDEAILKNLPSGWKRNREVVSSIQNAISRSFFSNPEKIENLFKKNIEIINYFKDDEDIKIARIDGWAKKVSVEPEIYEDESFPKDLKDDSKIRNSLRNGYVKRIKESKSPNIPPNAIKLFPNDDIIKEAVKSNIIESLQSSYQGFMSPGFTPKPLIIPESLKDDEDIGRMQKGSLLSIFRKNPFETFSGGGEINETFFPTKLRFDKDIIAAKAEGIAYNVLKNPNFYEDNKDQIASLNLLEDPGIIKATKKGFVQFFNENPDLVWIIAEMKDDHFVRQHMLNDMAFLEIMKKNLAIYLSQAPSSYLVSLDFWKRLERLPQNVKNDKRVLIAYKNGLAKLMVLSPWEYLSEGFPKSFKDNKAIIDSLKVGLIDYFNRIATRYLISKELKGNMTQLPRSIFDAEPNQDNPVVLAYKNAIARLLKSSPIEYDSPDFPKGLKRDPIILTALNELKKKWITNFKRMMNETSLDVIRNEINTSDTMPDLIKQEILDELNLQTAVAKRSIWYKKAKNLKVIDVKKMKEIIN